MCTTIEEKQKDKWDKIDIILKIFIACLVASFGFFGNSYLQEKRKIDSNIKLYTQILSNKESSENLLRKDMFEKILTSFLDPKESAHKDAASKINEMHLSLELLSRNFHESLDMKPLFKNLLLEIVHEKIYWKRFEKRVSKFRETHEKILGSTNIPVSKFEHNETFEEIIDFFSQSIEHTSDSIFAKLFNTERQLTEDSRSEILYNIDKFEKKINGKYRKCGRELDRLIKTAQRITRKQCEILENVSGILKIEIPLNGDDANKICTTYKPGDYLPLKEGKCETGNGDKDCSEKTSADDKPKILEGVSKEEKQLTFKHADGKNDINSSRYFKLNVRYAYPKWRQVYVEVLSCPAVDEDMTEKKCRQNPEREDGGFWLEYFDFPLVDSTYLNTNQRYSIILKDFIENEDGEYEKAEILLIYYPALYAGLKEKSFYDNQLMRSLLNSDLFAYKANFE